MEQKQKKRLVKDGDQDEPKLDKIETHVNMTILTKNQYNKVAFSLYPPLSTSSHSYELKTFKICMLSNLNLKIM